MRELHTQIMEGQPLVSSTAGSMNSLVDKLAKVKNRPLAIQGLQQDLVILQKDFFQKVSRRHWRNLQVEAWMKQVRELVFDIEDWIDQTPEMGGQQMEIEDEIKSFKSRVEHVRELCERYHLVIEVPTDLHDPFAVVPSQAKIDRFLLAVDDPADEYVNHLTREQEKRLNELEKLLEGEQKMLKVVSILGMEGLGKSTLAEEIYAKLQGKFDCHAFVSVGKRTSMIATLMEILHKVKSSNKQKVKRKTNNPRAGRREAKDLQQVITDLSEFLSKKSYFILVDGLWSTRVWKIINCALPKENRGSRILTTTCISDVAKCCSVRPSDVYQMVPLSEEMSQGLYQKTTREGLCLDDYDEATRNMLQMCDGMPLAIIVTAGLLAMKSKEATVPNKFENCILASPEHCSTTEGMVKILNMSYAALSLPLKSCFLYLSVFREDYVIKKDRLIRLWMAEGFIPIDDKEIRGEVTTRGEETRVEKTTRYEERRDEKIRGEETTSCEERGGQEITGDEKTRGQKSRSEERTRGEETEGQEITGGEQKSDEESLWETGEMYFNELITRRLIQPVFDYIDDQAMGCTVHGVILDFVKSLSSKGNFVTLRADLSSECSTDTVRRFSLDCYNDEDKDGTLASITVHLSRVRSITILGDIEGMDGRSALTASGKIGGVHVLPSFKLIRVLDLEDTYHLKSHHLKGIGDLVLLRHLGVAGTDIDDLPYEIEKLEKLETLDLRHTKLRILGEFIAKQKRLAHLLIEHTVKLPSVIMKVQGLEEVSTIGVDSSSSIDSVVELMRKSESLRVLGVRLNGSHLISDNKSVKSFIWEVAKSEKLTSLSLDYRHIDLLGLLLEFPPSGKLRRFELTTSVPILRGTAHKMASLVRVTHMDIEIIDLDDEGVRVLEELPNLVLFNLLSSGSSTQYKKSIKSSRKITKDRCILDMGGFKRLKVFCFRCRSGGTELEFKQGAMRELRRLWIKFSARETMSLYGNFSFGIEHLSSLEQVNATINCKSATGSAVKNAEDEIRAQLGNFSIVPTLSRVNQHMMLPDHKAKTTTYPNIWINGCIPNFKIA